MYKAKFVLQVKMVKIFVGNLSDDATEQQLSELFKPYGEITECAVLNRFGFVVRICRALKSILELLVKSFSSSEQWFHTQNDN